VYKTLGLSAGHPTSRMKARPSRNLVVLAGGAQTHFRRGRLLDFDNQASFADMLVSCFHYMGFDDVTSFGDPRLQQTGALSGLT
jgi:hypothetical protein